MFNESWRHGDSSDDFDINEVTDTSNETNDVINGGSVEDWRAWELYVREFLLKEKARPYITGVVLSTWSIAVVASVINLLITGNFLFAVPPTLISVPLCIVLRYYFSRG